MVDRVRIGGHVRPFLEVGQRSAKVTDLIERAVNWANSDPDQRTRQELLELVEKGDLETLAEIMGATLEFGTAGIRGAVGPGSNQMNRAVVIRTSRGLADFLIQRAGGIPEAPVIIGFDARPTSRQFAEDAAAVIAGSGMRVLYFDDVTPTPLVAFTARYLKAVAAVVVTASHNPPQDNGYKVYDSNAAQIIPPVDTDIAQAIEEVGPANEVERVAEPFSGHNDLIQTVPDGIVDAYWAEVSANRPIEPETTVRIVYTPLHGVGSETLLDIFGRTVHRDITAVPEQRDPDGSFPTVAFPNPEEPGALDLAMDLAREIEADLVIGNDPDADRLAAAVRWRDGWRLLTGNELGVILGSYILRNWRHSETPITGCSVVSSPMLSQISEEAGAVHLTTLTGFKWIANAAMAAEREGKGVFAFGYEEALGYTVGQTVRDKDGISAALLLADVAALERGRDRSLLDVLADLWIDHGIWVSTQKSITRPGEKGQAELVSAVEHIAAETPSSVGGLDVSSMTDYRVGSDQRPPWLGEQDLIELTLGDRGRILVRPSGTEPKLKIYVDLRAPVEDSSAIHAQRDDLLEQADSMGAAVEQLLTDFLDA
ncbi:MAG: phospho-sugar mutase [Actinobacteria bacterium]|nr:MAG: phospho-sugar mutase [Actinomycetota bacterium]